MQERVDGKDDYYDSENLSLFDRDTNVKEPIGKSVHAAFYSYLLVFILSVFDEDWLLGFLRFRIQQAFTLAEAFLPRRDIEKMVYL